MVATSAQTHCTAARRLRVLIALTGWTAATDQAQAYRSGFDFYVHKPAEPQRLLQMIVSRSNCAHAD